MILTCTSFATSVLPGGKIQLVLIDGHQDGAEDKISIKEIASLLGVSRMTVYNLSRLKRKPLPLVRGKGRPYGLRSALTNWLRNDDLDTNARRALRVFGN